MFCSNQKFNVCGDTRENLEKAIECVMAFMDAEKMSQYKIMDGYIVFTEFDEQGEGFEYIPICGTVYMMATMIETYLKSKDARPYYENQYEGGDGSYHNGWEIFISDDYDICGDYFCVRPFKTYYSK